jgi:hypothetical protein
LPCPSIGSIPALRSLEIPWNWEKCGTTYGKNVENVEKMWKMLKNMWKKMRTCGKNENSLWKNGEMKQKLGEKKTEKPLAKMDE